MTGRAWAALALLAALHGRRATPNRLDRLTWARPRTERVKENR